MSDLRSQLSSSLGGYSIERELGGGGMARVFLAVDKALNRPVVIKVLTPELAANVSTKRFEREIRLAATLQHANIVPVLSAGETDGMPHYTMPYVQGQSLRQLLDHEGRLGIGQTVSILRDVGRALSYAHERGVVHRDIKPENVLLAGDAAVVSDFGIAKAIDNARHSDGGQARRESTVTQIGSAVGTPAYMSPEQVSADPSVDHRADIYSFGCVAYEILTGAAPFEGRPVHALFAAHLSASPVPIGEKRPDTPPSLARLVTQCLEKDPAKRPQSARDILSALEGVAAPASGVAKLWQGLTRRQRVAVGAAVALLLVAAAVVQWRASASARISSVAVVPFLNVSGDSADEYLADGLADGLATALGKLPGVRVVSRSAAYHYKGQRLSAHEIGKQLSASHVVQGSLRRIRGRLIVDAQLASAGNNEELWSERYDRTAADVLTFPDEVTRSIVAALRGRLSREAAVAPAAPSIGTTNQDAYDLYLRGRFLLRRRGRGVRQAIEKFEQAIAKDTNFARAYGALALSLELLPYFEGVNVDSLGRVAIPAARRALTLDSTLAEAHTALALGHWHKYEWRLAEAEHRKAVTLDPGEPDAHIQYGRFLHYTGRLREALAEFERAKTLDPYSAVASGWVGHLLELRGETRRALTELRRAIELDSTSAPTLHMLAEGLQQAGEVEEAKRIARALGERVPEWRAHTLYLLARFGEREPALTALRDMEAGSAFPWRWLRFNGAMLYLSVGDTARVLDEFERATDEGLIWPTNYSLSERSFDPLRSNPRFAVLVRRVGLDERIFTSRDGGRSR